MAHQKSPGRKTGIFCCAIPLAGAASAFAQALRLSSRGPVAKNAPQERFLHAPADDAPKKSRSKDRDFLLRHPPGGGGLARRAVRSCSPRGDRSLKTLRRSVFFTRPLMAHRVSRGRGSGGGGTQGLAAYAGTGRSEDRDFLLRHPLRGGFGVRASAPPQLAGKSLKTLRRSVFFTRPLMTHRVSRGRGSGGGGTQGGRRRNARGGGGTKGAV